MVVLYGDFNNWFATYAFWLFEAYGHEEVKIMDGGRTAWAKEEAHHAGGAQLPKDSVQSEESGLGV